MATRTSAKQWAILGLIIFVNCFGYARLGTSGVRFLPHAQLKLDGMPVEIVSVMLEYESGVTRVRVWSDNEEFCVYGMKEGNDKPVALFTKDEGLRKQEWLYSSLIKGATSEKLGPAPYGYSSVKLIPHNGFNVECKQIVSTLDANSAIRSHELQLSLTNWPRSKEPCRVTYAEDPTSEFIDTYFNNSGQLRGLPDTPVTALAPRHYGPSMKVTAPSKYEKSIKTGQTSAFPGACMYGLKVTARANMTITAFGVESGSSIEEGHNVWGDVLNPNGDKIADFFVEARALDGAASKDTYYYAGFWWSRLKSPLRILKGQTILIGAVYEAGTSVREEGDLAAWNKLFQVSECLCDDRPGSWNTPSGYNLVKSGTPTVPFSVMVAGEQGWPINTEIHPPLSIEKGSIAERRAQRQKDNEEFMARREEFDRSMTEIKERARERRRIQAEERASALQANDNNGSERQYVPTGSGNYPHSFGKIYGFGTMTTYHGSWTAKSYTSSMKANTSSGVAYRGSKQEAIDKQRRRPSHSGSLVQTAGY